MKRVVVHIDQLALKGLRNEDRHAIADALRGELGRQLAEPDAARRVLAHGDVSRLRIGTVRIAPGATPARIGTQAASGIARRIKS